MFLNKRDRKATKKAFRQGFNFALSFHEIGKAHKAEGKEKQTFEEFFKLNNFDNLDFKKDDVDIQTRKQMTEEFVKKVIYPAYNGGYEGNPIF